MPCRLLWAEYHSHLWHPLQCDHRHRLFFHRLTICCSHLLMRMSNDLFSSCSSCALSSPSPPSVSADADSNCSIFAAAPLLVLTQITSSRSRPSAVRSLFFQCIQPPLLCSFLPTVLQSKFPCCVCLLLFASSFDFARFSTQIFATSKLSSISCLMLMLRC